MLDTLLETRVLVIWSLVLTAAIVVALAGYLVAVVYHLRRAGGSDRSRLARLAAGLETVSRNVEPLDERLSTAAGALSALDARMSSVADHLDRMARALR